MPRILPAADFAVSPASVFDQFPFDCVLHEFFGRTVSDGADVLPHPDPQCLIEFDFHILVQLPQTLQLPGDFLVGSGGFHLG